VRDAVSLGADPDRSHEHPLEMCRAQAGVSGKFREVWGWLPGFNAAASTFDAPGV
jgi:hypothetical protein